MANVVQGAGGGVRRLAVLSAFGATCGAAGGVFVVTGRGIPCPFREVTGLLCPVCGASRMGESLLQGDLVAAWQWNPFMLVLGVLLGLVWLWTLVGVVAGRSVVLPGPFGALEGAGAGRLLLALVSVALIWAFARNLV